MAFASVKGTVLWKRLLGLLSKRNHLLFRGLWAHFCSLPKQLSWEWNQHGGTQISLTKGFCHMRASFFFKIQLGSITAPAKLMFSTLAGFVLIPLFSNAFLHLPHKSVLKFYCFWRAFLYLAIKVTLMWLLQPCVSKVPSSLGERLNIGQISLVLPLLLMLYLHTDKIHKIPYIKNLLFVHPFQSMRYHAVDINRVIHWHCWSLWPKFKKKSDESTDFVMQYC